MKIESKKNDNGDLEIKLLFDAHDQICLEHDLLDIVDWFATGPSQEKIYNCRSRMIKECKDILLASPEMASMTMAEVNKIMSDPVALCEAIRKMPDYKNRKEREAISR